jgi:hypothetical protein
MRPERWFDCPFCWANLLFSFCSGAFTLWVAVKLLEHFRN